MLFKSESVFQFFHGVEYLSSLSCLKLGIQIDAIWHTSVVAYGKETVGRLIFGAGNESLWVAQYVFVGRYFGGKWGLSLAYCVVLSAARTGFLLNTMFSKKIADATSAATASLVGVGACVISLIAGIVIVWMERSLWKEQTEREAESKKENANHQSVRRGSHSVGTDAGKYLHRPPQRLPNQPLRRRFALLRDRRRRP
jgi:hypothetical protein